MGVLVLAATYATVQAQTVTSRYAASGTFVPPGGVTNITVSAWGGGGGTRTDGTSRWGGGGGGAYARASLDVEPGTACIVTVGEGGAAAATHAPAGGDSWFASTATLRAQGGSGGSTNGGAGGSAATSVGDVRYSGGSGGNRGTTSGGGGGWSAWAHADGHNGGNGSGAVGGAGGTGEGAGGNGGNSGAAGIDGLIPGGGGGGRGASGATGGSGADGQIEVALDLVGSTPAQLDIAYLPSWSYKDSAVLVHIELQDSNGWATAASGTITVDLSTSLMGVFRNLADTADITSIPIAPGEWSAQVLYRPLRVGPHILTAQDSASVLAEASGDLTCRYYPVPVQDFYLPVPADQLLEALTTLHGGATWLASQWTPVSPVWNYVVITVSSDDTLIYYDHMENGFETNIRNPTNQYHSVTNLSGTQIWGDGNPLNGHPPGMPDDIIGGQTTIVLINSIDVPDSPDPENPLFRAGDKIAASKAIAVTWAGWASQSATLLAGANEVYDTSNWGTNYRVPVGEDLPDNVDHQMFEYAGAAIMAGRGGAELQIDSNNDESWDELVILQEGESYLVDGGLSVGARILSDNPVQVDLITGDRQDGYESRFYRLVPTHIWGDSYYTPVSTPGESPQESGTEGTDTTVWLYNPNSTNIQVAYAWRARANMVSDMANDTVSYPSAPLSGTSLGNVYGPLVELNSDGSVSGTTPDGAWVGLVNRSAGNSPSIASKVGNAQSAGASAVLIVNNTGGTNFPTDTAGSSRVIPVVGIAQNDGAALRSAGIGAGWVRVSGDSTSNTLTIAANSYAKQVLTDGSGGHFYTLGKEPFYALSTTDSTGTDLSNNSPGQNRTWDWGFTLVPRNSLTPHLLVGLGIGRDPTSTISPNENGSPVWLTTIGNGDSNTAVYVDYDADPTTGAFVDPSGYRYDLALTIRELELVKVFNPSGNQTGILIYTLDEGVRLAAAWGQDVLTSSTGAPGLDMGTGIPPLPEFYATKRSALWFDHDADGYVSPGDHLEYAIEIFNISRVPVDDIRVEDHLPDSVEYLPDTTFFTDENDLRELLPDDLVDTPFPLDDGGFVLPRPSLAPGHGWRVEYRVEIKTYEELPENTETVMNSAVISTPSVPDPIHVGHEDPINGRIGNFVWRDVDSDGIQDSGEPGFPNVIVALYNSDGGWLSSTTTDADGWYQFPGILAGEYRLLFQAPPGYLFTTQDADAAGLRGANNSDVDPVTGWTDSFTLDSGESLLEVDAGLMPGADLEVSKTAFARVVQEDGQAVFAIVVSNRGAAATTGVVIEDILPVGLNYESHMTSRGTYSPASGLWGVGSLDVGASATLDLVARVEPGTAHTVLTNVAQVTAADMPDPNLANNDSFATVSVSALRLVKTAEAPAYLDVNDVITYMIVASNAGSQIQTALQLSDPLPEGLNLVPGSLSLALIPESSGGYTIQPGSGGTITQIEENGTNFYLHTFTGIGSHSFTPPPEISSVEVLVVAGGGGGAGSTGNAGRGGGGAGGVVHETAVAISSETIAVGVGAGGAGGASGGQSGFNGQNSTFGSLEARGGGGGGNLFLNGNAGGSGGGAGINNSGYLGGTGEQPGSASGGFGEDGGRPGAYQVGAGGGGGGGAGGVGGSGGSNIGGAGGAGRQFLAFASVIGSPFGWVGGGGGASAGTYSGPAGTGGGGEGGTDSLTPGSGMANTGGGGGGSQNSAGGNGGSGVVAIRYPAGLAASTKINFNSTTTFTVPLGVTSLVVEAWGGGGGPRNDYTTRRGGGGGGAYARATVAVTPAATYDVVVGQGGAVAHSGSVGNSGGDTYFGDGTAVLARGGAGGTDSGGAGGSAATSIGTLRYSGGSGGNRSSYSSGGGGGGGGSAYDDANGLNGADGSWATGGDGGDGEGAGGDGGNNGQAGQPGMAPGGGGGARGSNGGDGGAGANGRIRITYENPSPQGLTNSFPDFATGWQLVPGQRLEATFQVQVADLLDRAAITNLVTMSSIEHTDPLVAWVLNPTVLIPPDVLSYAILDPARITNQVSDGMMGSGQVIAEFIVYHPANLVLEGATFDLLDSGDDMMCTNIAFRQMDSIQYEGNTCQLFSGHVPRTYPVPLGTGRARISVRAASGVWLQSQTHAGSHPMEFAVLDNDVTPPAAMGALFLNGQPAPSANPDRYAINWFSDPTFLIGFDRVLDPAGDDGLLIQQQESSGICEYRITTAAVDGLTPAQRAQTGMACPVMAIEGALANPGFERTVTGWDWTLNSTCSFQTRDADPTRVYAGEQSLRQIGGGEATQLLVFENSAGVTPQIEFSGWVRGGGAELQLTAYATTNRLNPVDTLTLDLDTFMDEWTAANLPRQPIGNESVEVLEVTLRGHGAVTYWDHLKLVVDMQTNRASLHGVATVDMQGAMLQVYAVDADENRPDDNLAGAAQSCFLPFDA
ncbi:MAG: SdrD B-like domain-containing protein, partial [Kiritimatiellia bacterium]|nr:SdrD B-like domain-containing protein [Kiritimatiellia bacterium]